MSEELAQDEEPKFSGRELAREMTQDPDVRQKIRELDKFSIAGREVDGITLEFEASPDKVRARALEVALGLEDGYGTSFDELDKKPDAESRLNWASDPIELPGEGDNYTRKFLQIRTSKEIKTPNRDVKGILLETVSSSIAGSEGNHRAEESFYISPEGNLSVVDREEGKKPKLRNLDVHKDPGLFAQALSRLEAAESELSRVRNYKRTKDGDPHSY